MRNYSKMLRIWHWLFALTTLGMIGTVILRKTFLSWRTNSELIMEKLSGYGIDIAAEQAKVIAKAIRAPMWEWHIILGYVLAALFLWRLVMIIKDGFGYEEVEDQAMKKVHLLYKVIYIVFLVMIMTGIVLHNNQAIGISKDFSHDIKEFHEAIAWGIMLFVPLHIIGVIVADLKKYKGIVSKMISG